MSEEKVCLSWNAQYTFRKTEASTLRRTENLHSDQYLLFDSDHPLEHKHKGKEKEQIKIPLYKRMAQHRRANSSGQESAVHLHLKAKNDSSEENNVSILDQDERWS